MVKTQIHWIPLAEGGRKNIPAGSQYAPVAKFEELSEVWSVVLNFEGAPDSEGNSCADLRFLVEENAPKQVLYLGSRFELYEGPKRVATGQIISE